MVTGFRPDLRCSGGQHIEVLTQKTHHSTARGNHQVNLQRGEIVTARDTPAGGRVVRGKR